jgi:two-component system, NarL family, nitrate/nitrite response regulator NarL
MTDGSIRLALADDHPLFLRGLQALFAAEPDLEVVAACRSGKDALDAVRKHRPDILVLDIRMPGLDGFAALKAMRQECLSPRVVLLTADISEDETLEALRLGVNGVVLKEMAPNLLVLCIRKVHAGEQWLEKESTGRALGALLKREAGRREIAGMLTPREIEIVRMTATGLRNTQIGVQLSVSEGTVKTHLHHIYEKLGVNGRLGLILLAREKGLT